MEIDLPHYKYPTATQQTSFFRELLEKVRRTPGVKSAGIEQPGSNVFFEPEGQPAAEPGQEPSAGLNVVSPGDFGAKGIRMAAGREFVDNDTSEGPPVALISETVARRYWPHENPLGKNLTVLAHVYSGQSAGPAEPLRIVGVVKDRRGYDLW